MAGNTSSDVDPEREVRRLHLMLEDWYGGIRDDIDPITSALASDFTSIAADGTLRDHTESVQRWRDERTAYRQSSHPVQVELEDITVRRTLYGVHQVTYRKEIHTDEGPRAFNCSLWLRETARVPSGLQWLHLQETPITAEPDDSEED